VNEGSLLVSVKAIAGLVLTLGLFNSAPAHAATVSTFTFSGQCTTDCTGQATATLVLTGVAPGNTVNINNFVSFTYHSNFFDLSLNGIGTRAGQTQNLGGILPATPNAPASFAIASQGQIVFATLLGGAWCVGKIECGNDSGLTSTWAPVAAASVTATPVPAALPLFVTGLGALGLLGWRRKRKARSILPA
jgi:hypothetical protein